MDEGIEEIKEQIIFEIPVEDFLKNLNYGKEKKLVDYFRKHI